MKAYKGMDKNMRCREFQYEPGKTYEQETATVCGPGFHSCTAPLDVLHYYGLNKENRFFEVEADGIIAKRENEDSKLASSRLTIGAEIGLPGLIKAHMEYTKEKAEKNKTAGGDDSNLAGGNWSNLAGGDDSNLACGDWSNLAGGDWSAILGRNNCKAKAGLRSIICLSEWEWDENDNYVPVHVKAAIVGGETLKPDTWYTLKGGEFVEAEE